ncbi:phospho-N-acetylmuramoyl-pentapeptide-transferase [endosymbiont of Sipalinus gigas]|uniref:phospho-N-acetylmuramoyl-pentapeptide- transferase n=1 Tax=endosymbiont of Sipalinus gigas TaxID=1972134 RepID=UPI000DC73F89|nr:phospho-N-acetylmuramoyl-pentapeptide-transferase [endosymbiont of Sipalinus gigas]BBA85175.1 phospho-N-acetylmuramoyl-pentapeptide-transferase [endosymbiont of Sipalinus gigas]
MYKNITKILFSILTSFFTSLILVKFIKFILNKKKFFQYIRYEGPKSHYIKKNTPTMGGISIITSILINLLFYTKINKNILYIIISCLLNSILGLIDDVIKILNKKDGIYPRYKLLFQIVLYYIIINKLKINKKVIFIPFYKKKYVNINKFIYYLISFFTLLGSINSVNLTDGLDGLISVISIFILTLLIIISFISENLYLSKYFNIIHIPNNNIYTICSITIGSIIGFLWYNSYPSEIFLGDVGSLSIGYLIGLIHIIFRKELLLLISGLLLIIESLSVIIQVFTYKYFNKKRIFLMSPIHHHFELKGIHESKISFRFWILSFILFIISILAIMKK